MVSLDSAECPTSFQASCCSPLCVVIHHQFLQSIRIDLETAHLKGSIATLGVLFLVELLLGFIGYLASQSL